MAIAETTDTIPRTHQLLAHARALLAVMSSGADTFEDCRERYGLTQRELDAQGVGRLTASRVREQDRNWSPTKDLLQEFARWGAIEPRPLPSSRQFVDRYRDTRYPLTPLGEELAEAAAASQARFADLVSDLLLAAHPYLRNLLRSLARDPISVPELDERDLQRYLGPGRTMSALAAGLLDDFNLDLEPQTVEAELRKYWRRFRSRTSENPPTVKERLDATNKALLVACFRAAGVPTDSETIRTLLRWGTQLALYDLSRYVPGLIGRLTIWPCADIMEEADKLSVRRRGLAEHGLKVGQALVAAYEDQAFADDSAMARPVIPVHLVRADAAYRIQVTRRLCDLVLSRMVDGHYAELGVQPALYVGNTVPLPPSESPFKHHNQRRMALQINPKETA